MYKEKRTDLKLSVKCTPTTPPLLLLRYLHTVPILLHHHLKLTKQLLTLHNQ